MTALRTAAAATRLEQVRALRVSGPNATEVIDALTSSRLFIRESQMLHTLMLDGLARPFADVMVCQDEDSLILLAEGPTGAELLAHIERVRREQLPEARIEIADLLSDAALFGIDGPFAWEIASAVVGPEILGAPYLSFLKVADQICFRAGKTGEYGYLLLVPRDRAPAVWGQILQMGQPQGLIEASVEALDQCALENWHFSMRALSAAAVGGELTPIELQLQWRVDYDKDFVGAPALRDRRRAPLGRVTSFVAPEEATPGQRLFFGDSPVGTVLWTGWSAIRDQWVGWALIDLPLAWPGLRFEVGDAARRAPAETRSPPLLNNRSLHVDPHRHSHQTRDTDAFPPLVVS